MFMLLKAFRLEFRSSYLMLLEYFLQLIHVEIRLKKSSLSDICLILNKRMMLLWKKSRTMDRARMRA